MKKKKIKIGDLKIIICRVSIDEINSHLRAIKSPLKAERFINSAAAGNDLSVKEGMVRVVSLGVVSPPLNKLPASTVPELFLEIGKHSGWLEPARAVYKKMFSMN